jgi:phosphohistidine phosphatase SixA
VGHMPNIAALAELLSNDTRAFPLHGLVAFERQDASSRLWTEVWRAAPEP